MVDLDEFAMAKLAREMAMNIRNYQKIFADFGITEEDYYEISKIDFFKRAKEQFALEWNSTLSTADRVRLISLAYAEQGLPSVGRGMIDESKPFSDRLESFKALCRTGGLDNTKAAPTNPAERFVITINLGADTEHYDKSVAIDANDSAPKPPLIEAKPVEPAKPKRGRPPKGPIKPLALSRGLFDEH